MSENSINTLYNVAFHRIDSSLRWVHFISPPWIGENGTSMEAYVVFSHATRRIDKLELRSLEGNLIPATIEPVDELPEALSKFNDLPDHLKNFLKVEFELNKPEIVIGQVVEQDEVKPLFTLVPKIVYPSFIFDIVLHSAVAFGNTKFENFVETGTLFGHTAIHAACLFDSVFTIELDKELHIKASRLAKKFPNISFINGDSGVEINNLVGSLRGATVFFLDAHWSGDASVDWTSSRFTGFPSNTSHLGGKDESNPSSNEQVPLDKELNAIFEAFPDEAIIIVDDWQSIGKKDYAFVGEDWSHLSHQRLLDQFSMSDRVSFHYPYDEKHYVVGLNAIKR